MSLRTKILLLFLSFVVAPFLFIAVADYVQSLLALRALIEAKVETVAVATARDVGHRYRELEAELATLAGAEQVRVLLLPGQWPDRAGERAALLARFHADPALHGHFERIELVLPDGTVAVALENAGRAPDPVDGCRQVAAALPVVVPVASTVGELGWLRGLPRTNALLGERGAVALGQQGYQLLVDPETGRILHADRCALIGRRLAGELEADEAGAALLRERGLGSFRYARDRGTAAFARVEPVGWAVVSAASLDEFTRPYARLRAFWLLLVLFVTATGAVAFLLFLRPPLDAIRRLSVAAGEVGRGRLDVWLPPPSGDEVGRLSGSFGEMLARLRSMMRELESAKHRQIVGQMGAYVAHEIRNPLSALGLHVQTLLREVRAGRQPANTAEVLALAHGEVERLENVVAGFLAMGRARSGAQRLASLHQVVQQSVSVLRGDLRRRGVTIELGALATEDQVRIDEAAVQGAIVNLLLNAADAMPGGGRIRIWSELGRRPADDAPVIALHVCDEGQGVPPELRERIFEPFFSTKSSGNGIGLPVARQIAEEHGGRLYCTHPAELLSGADFVLALPLVLLLAGARETAAAAGA
jgi:signal transduction histidine kinase